MHILIDNQKSVTIPLTTAPDEEDQEHILVSIEDALKILEAWEELDPAHRSFTFVGDSHEGIDEVVVAWITANGELSLNESEMFWHPAGYSTNCFSLVDFATMFPDGMLQWGEAIGEPVE